MAFGFVLRDLLSAANYCALTPASPERQELLRWLQGAARRVRHMAEETGHTALVSPLTRLARAADAVEADPSQVERLITLVQAVFAAHDPPGLQPFVALTPSGPASTDAEDTEVLRRTSRNRPPQGPRSANTPRRAKLPSP